MRSFLGLFAKCVDVVLNLTFIGGLPFCRLHHLDLLDALGVEYVVRVQMLERRLFQIINGHIPQRIAVQILANSNNDFFPKCQTLVM